MENPVTINEVFLFGFTPPKNEQIKSFAEVKGCVIIVTDAAVYRVERVYSPDIFTVLGIQRVCML